MRLVIQRVKNASVTIDMKTVAAIGNGLLVLVGLGQGDDAPENQKRIEATLAKMSQLRIFPDENGAMNRSLIEHGGEILLVSQFTLYADCRKGRRPSFHLACPPVPAETLYAKLRAKTEEMLPGKVHSGIFGADMDVALTNWGPVTIILDSADF
ncbi:MAG: D-aminoacyl-tRNA deacylase [Desulfovibrio sp.]